MIAVAGAQPPQAQLTGGRNSGANVNRLDAPGEAFYTGGVLLDLRLLALLATAASGCQLINVDIEGRPCADMRCVQGYTCHPQTQRCVRSQTVACDEAGAICPETVETGSSCSDPGSFIPCHSGSNSCDEGCRTCLDDGTWSRCRVGDCTRDSDDDGWDDCDDNCPSIANADQADANLDSIGDACADQPHSPRYTLQHGALVTGGGSTASSNHDGNNSVGSSQAPITTSSEHFRLQGRVVLQP